MVCRPTGICATVTCSQEGAPVCKDVLGRPVTRKPTTIFGVDAKLLGDYDENVFLIASTGPAIVGLSGLEYFFAALLPPSHVRERINQFGAYVLNLWRRTQSHLIMLMLLLLYCWRFRTWKISRIRQGRQTQVLPLKRLA